MSEISQDSLKLILDQLECHFTWDLKKDDLDLTDLLNRLEEQVSLKEEIAQAKSSLGYVEFLLDHKEEALNNLLGSEKLIKENLGNNCEKTLIVTYGNLAWVYFHMNKFPECRSYLDKLEVIKKTFETESSSVPAVLGEKGWAFLKFSHKYYDRAVEVFQKAVKLDPYNSECNAGYAVALYRSVSVPCSVSAPCTVIKQLELAININPNDDVLKVFLAIHLLPCSNGSMKEKAKKFVEEAREGSPNHPHVLRYAAIFYRNLGFVDNAIALLNKALIYSTKPCFIYHQLGVCYKSKKINLHKENQGKTDEIDKARNQSIDYLEKAISLKPSFIIAMSELSVQYGERGELVKAKRGFEKAFETARKNNEHLQAVHFYYAQFQEYSNQHLDLAIKHYRECLKMNPQTTEGRKSANKLEKIEKRIRCSPNGQYANKHLELFQ